MKRGGIYMSFFLVAILPGILFSVVSGMRNREGKEDGIRINEVSYEISVLDGQEVYMMELDEYITGVLLGEIPADFETETLKAQAVTARTYTLARVGKSTKHPQADVCMEASCCQAFADPLTYPDDQYLARAKRAVTETAGQVITYNGKLIEATYFSCSGGRTEDAAAVWGTEIPYLVSVDSPGENQSEHYEKSYTISREKFLNLLGLPSSLMIYDDSIHFTFTEGGGVLEMSIGEDTFTGVQLRTLLNLPSTAFTLAFIDNDVRITTKGYGHRVGLSQYGAEAMAVNGSTYEQILKHYYPGTVLEVITQKQLQAVFDKAQIL